MPTLPAPPPAGDTGSRNILPIACNWGASSTQGVGGILVEGSIEVIEDGRPHQRAQAVSGLLPPAQYQEADKLSQPSVTGEVSHI